MFWEDSEPQSEASEKGQLDLLVDCSVPVETKTDGQHILQASASQCQVSSSWKIEGRYCSSFSLYFSSTISSAFVFRDYHFNIQGSSKLALDSFGCVK
jgi:hypothetical protein